MIVIPFFILLGLSVNNYDYPLINFRSLNKDMRPLSSVIKDYSPDHKLNFLVG